MPKTTLGKWSVGLHISFLIVIISLIFLIYIFKILNFEDLWWNLIVLILFSTSIIAFILGIIAKRKYQDNSVSVLLSILLGLCVIIFILTHSLFISD